MRHEFIEPEHLFIGVCKLGNLPSLGNWSDAGIPRAAAAALKAEAEAVAATFQKTGHDRVTLYRDVRKRLGEGSLQVLDEMVGKEVEKCRRVNDIVDLLSYLLSIGSHWLPDGAKVLFEKELEQRKFT